VSQFVRGQFESQGSQDGSVSYGREQKDKSGSRSKEAEAKKDFRTVTLIFCHSQHTKIVANVGKRLLMAYKGVSLLGPCTHPEGVYKGVYKGGFTLRNFSSI